jgi:hypothetical protein
MSPFWRRDQDGLSIQPSFAKESAIGKLLERFLEQSAFSG